MAKHLKEAAKQTAFRCLIAGVSATACMTSYAQGLPDPTRPPSELAPGAYADESSSTPVLQSVIISPVRAEAIISGKIVTVGDKVGDAKVMKITEHEVLLRHGDTVQTLKLFPNIDKRPVQSRAGNNMDTRRP